MTAPEITFTFPQSLTNRRPLESWYSDTAEQRSFALSCLISEWHSLGTSAPFEVTPWREYPCESGRIDLLLRIVWEDSSYRLRVFYAAVEFKRDAADEDAVAQSLRYCGSLSDGKRRFHPVVCAASFTRRALWAAKAADVMLVTMRTKYSTSGISTCTR